MKKEVKLMQKFSFISFIGGQKLLYMLVSGFATVYYVSYLKIDPVLIAFIIFATRIFDAVNDPFIGMTIDRLKIKLKTYTNVIAFLLPLMTFLMFMAPVDKGAVTITYVVVTYVVWSLLYTIGEVPIYAIVMRMTKNLDEQNYLFSISQVGSIGGVVLGLVVTIFFVSGGIDNINWQLMSLVFSVLGFIQMFNSIVFIKEKYPKAKASEKLSLKTSIKNSLSNKQLYIIMIIYTSQLFLNASTVLSIYVFDGYYGRPSLGSMIGLLSMVLIFPIAFSVPVIIKKYGKTNLMYLAGSIMIFANLTVLMTQNVNILLVMLILSSVSVIIPSLLRPMYIQECIEHERETKNITSEATAFSIMTFFNKAGDAIGATLGTLILGFIGFDQTILVSAQSSETLELARMFYFMGPMLMGTCWILGLKYAYGLKNKKSVKINVNLSQEQYEVNN